jgi:hypothetical protein
MQICGHPQIHNTKLAAKFADTHKSITLNLRTPTNPKNLMLTILQLNLKPQDFNRLSG